MNKNIWKIFSKNLFVVVGVVLVWRGIWHLLDIVDVLVFAGDKFWTALGGIVVGIGVLYLPDKDLKELGRL